MALAEPVVTELTIDASGAEQGQAQYVRAMANAQISAQRTIEVSSRVFEVNAAQAKVTSDLAAANDNLARSYGAANDNNKSYGRSLLDTGSSILETASHLKLLALAAYAVSPALRAITNSSFAAGARLLGANFTLVSAALGRMIAFVGPALSFVATIALPVTAAVAAFTLLNAVWSQGASLIEKYGNAYKDLYDKDVAENLTKLTKFQTDTISPQQVQYATELGARLNVAKSTISDFFKLEIDLTDPALKLQSIWVKIVETIASGVTKLNDWRAAGQNTPEYPRGYEDPDFLKPAPESPAAAEAAAAQAMKLARGRLAAGLGRLAAGVGGGFQGQFSQEINDLANPPKPAADAAKTVSEYDRLERSLQRQAAAQEAEAKAVGASVGEHERLRTEMRLQEAALQDISKNGGSLDNYAARIKTISDRMGAAAQQAAELRLASNTAFDRSQLGRDPVEASVASQLKSVYGADGYESQMNGVLAGQIRLTEQLKIGKDAATDFFGGFARDVSNGVAPLDALNSALGRLKDKLLDMAVNNLVSAAFGGNKGSAPGLGGIGGIFSSLFGGGGGIETSANTSNQFFAPGPQLASANGNAFLSGNVIPFARGGIVNRPTVFAMQNGAGLMGEAGPEAVMPLRRGSDGRLGVSAGGGAPVFNHTIINNAGADVKTSEPRPNGTGGFDIDTLLEKKINTHIASGGADAAAGQRWGVRNRTPRRG